VLLLILAFSTPAMLHAGHGGHADFAVQFHDADAMQADAGTGESCCTDHDGHAHGPNCSTTIACSPCVPASASDVAPSPALAAIGVALTAHHSGSGPFLPFRPPRLS
jgi:hypothetical protein